MFLLPIFPLRASLPSSHPITAKSKPRVSMFQLRVYGHIDSSCQRTLPVLDFVPKSLSPVKESGEVCLRETSGERRVSERGRGDINRPPGASRGHGSTTQGGG